MKHRPKKLAKRVSAKRKTKTKIVSAIGSASGRGSAVAVGTGIVSAVGKATLSKKKGRGRPRKASTIEALNLMTEQGKSARAAAKAAARAGETSEQVRGRTNSIRRYKPKGG